MTIEIHDEAIARMSDGYSLCLQRVTYPMKDGSFHEGLRLIWREPNGNMMPMRGQSRIPTFKMLKALIAACEAGEWPEPDSHDTLVSIVLRITVGDIPTVDDPDGTYS